jgi:hypothetical protein
VICITHVHVLYTFPHDMYCPKYVIERLLCVENAPELMPERTPKNTKNFFASLKY